MSSAEGTQVQAQAQAQSFTIQLNNYLQSQNRLSSLSWADSTAGPAHSPMWTSVCKIDGEAVSNGTGTQKHVARDMAAKEALRILAEQAEAAEAA